MKKIYLENLKIEKLLADSQCTRTYLLANGDVLKIYASEYLKLLSTGGISIENRTLNAKEITNVPEIIVPKMAVYNQDEHFMGTIMERANGIDFNEYDKNLSIDERKDLYKYAKCYLKLEDIVKRANGQGIVFPDLCTVDNIYIDEKGNFQLIDYDGIQINDNVVDVISSSLGNQMQYFNPKYMRGNLFTPNLDKKSLAILYFYDTFNVPLNSVGNYHPYLEKNITLDDIFEQINLENDDMKHKIWKLFINNVDNEFLGNTVLDLAEQYELDITPIKGNNRVFLKRLRRK